MAQMVHPDHVLRPEEAGELSAYEPVYPLVAGITQRVVQKSVASTSGANATFAGMDRRGPDGARRLAWTG